MLSAKAALIRQRWEGSDEYLDMFQNEVWIRVAEAFLVFSTKRRNGTGDAERIFVRLARVDARMASVLIDLMDWEAR